MESKADIALIGLAVMGQNLILNMNDHGFTVVAFNRTVSKVDDFINKEAKGTKVIGAHSFEEMAGLLKRPGRRWTSSSSICCLSSNRETLSLTAATRYSRTRRAGRNTWNPRACFTLA